MDGTIYLLHIEPPYKHARHYLGWTSNTVSHRVEQHVRGEGSPLIRAAVQAGHSVTLVRTWLGVDRYYERKLKRTHNVPRLCPMCNP